MLHGAVATAPDPVPDELAARLRAAGCVFAEEEAAVLREAAAAGADLEALTAARVAGRPLEHLVGWVDFAGVRVLLDDGVFVPRRRSALLVDLVADRAPDGGTVVDLCCGSGAIGAALAARRPDLTVHAADLDPTAVACARRNLSPDRVHEGDLLDALPASLSGIVDVLVVNAPYVPTARIPDMPPEARDHEPLLALDGGGDGLDHHRRIVATMPPWLSKDGVLAIETSTDQAPVVAGLLTTAETIHDEDRGGTAVVGR